MFDVTKYYEAPQKGFYEFAAKYDQAAFAKDLAAALTSGRLLVLQINQSVGLEADKPVERTITIKYIEKVPD